MHQKKRHHFIAQTYLREFCNSEGKVRVYSKDHPTTPWWSSTEAIAFENYYYSQPLPNGVQDNNKLEDAFSDIESEWPNIVTKIRARERHEGGLDQLVQFAIMHRIRVPSARDATEKILAESVRMTVMRLRDQGQLQPPPAGLNLEDLIENMAISIDPHRSIHAMAILSQGMIEIVHKIGFRILENSTSEDFITSDNPVVYFDPDLPLRSMRPYNIINNIEFMFPITPRFILWGHSALGPRNGAPHVAKYDRIDDKSFVRRANVLVTRFANRMVFANRIGLEPLVKKYANLSPIASIAHIESSTGRGILAQYQFGKREAKPKWTR